MRMEVDVHSFLEHILLNVGACLAIIKPTRIASIEERVAIQESFSACIASHGTTIFLVWVSFMSLQRMTLSQTAVGLTYSIFASDYLDCLAWMSENIEF